jgi:hypothetical protein
MQKKTEYVLIALILCTQAILGSYLHWGYLLPLHVDEWKSFAYARTIQTEGIPFHDPYFGTTLYKTHLEIGFFVLLASIQSLTGMSWTLMFSVLAVSASTLITLSFYVLGKHLGIGAYAAALSLVIPSSAALLGPVFLVPITLGIILLLACWRIGFQEPSSNAPYGALVLVSTALIYVHPPTFIAEGMVIFLFAIMVRSQHALKACLAVVGAFILGLPQYWDVVALLSKGSVSATTFSSVAVFAQVYREIGVLMTVIFVAGILWSVSASPKIRALTLSAVVLLVLNTVYRILGVSVLIPPTRNYLLIFVLMVLIGAFAFKEMDALKSSLHVLVVAVIIFVVWLMYAVNVTDIAISYRLRPEYNVFFVYGPFLLLILLGLYALQRYGNPQATKKVVAVLLLIAVLIPGVIANLRTGMYHVITDAESAEYAALDQKLEGKVLMDPWKALALSPMTNTKVFNRVPDGPDPKAELRNAQASVFLLANCTNSSFMKENNVRFVISDRSGCGHFNPLRNQSLMSR